MIVGRRLQEFALAFNVSIFVLLGNFIVGFVYAALWWGRIGVDAMSPILGFLVRNVGCFFLQSCRLFEAICYGMVFFYNHVTSSALCLLLKILIYFLKNYSSFLLKLFH
jgi:hypothetical protein